MTLHATLADEIVSRFGDQLDGAPQLGQDALTLHFQNGLVLQARFASPEEYSIQWRIDDMEQRIDTAPLHPELSTFPHHLHDSQGKLHPDPLTIPGKSPWDNIRAVLDVVLVKPLVAGGESSLP